MRYNPPAGSQDPDAKYVTGQPGKARGSAVPAEAVEHPQREIVEVIKQAGLEPSGDDLTQLWQAIRQIIIVAKPGLATTKTPGLVQIGDGLTITAQGLLSVLVASVSQAGIMRPDGITCTVVGGVLSVQQQTSEKWRTSWIGVPRPWRSTALPPSHCWANGDFVPFADWPELEQVYAAGGFEGMLMAWDADGETQAANLGQWRPDAAEPTGLYTPVLTGQFMRCWEPGAEEGAGVWHRDEIRNIVGQAGVDPNGASGCFSDGGSSTTHQGSSRTGNNLFFNASAVVPTGAQTVPQHIWLPAILYLGKPAKETA